MHLLDRIDHWGKTAPDTIAHISDTTLTYGQLLARSNALAAWLDAELPHDRSPIAVIGHREPEMLVAFLGAVKSGRPYVPLDTALPEQRIKKIVGTAGATLTLTPEHIARITDQYVGALPSSRRLKPDDPFYI